MMLRASPNATSKSASLPGITFRIASSSTMTAELRRWALQKEDVHHLAHPRIEHRGRGDPEYTSSPTFSSRPFTAPWTGSRQCGKVTLMSFCEHCQGQRFDRAQVLRALRDTQRHLRQSGRSKAAEQALTLAIKTIRGLEIPHLEADDDDLTGASVH